MISRMFAAFFLAASLEAVAQAGGLHGITGGQKEIEAKYTSRSRDGTVVTWTTDATEMPTVDKNNDTCARMPEYGSGGICYRICGGGLTSTPSTWTYQWRPAHKGHQTPWIDCSDAQGCRGFSPEYYGGPGRGCAVLMVWKGQMGPRDLRVNVKLSPKTEADIARLKDRAAVQNKPSKVRDPVSGDRVGKIPIH